jgi:hypothetical protein
MNVVKFDHKVSVLNNVGISHRTQPIEPIFYMSSCNRSSP